MKRFRQFHFFFLFLTDIGNPTTLYKRRETVRTLCTAASALVDNFSFWLIGEGGGVGIARADRGSP